MAGSEDEDEIEKLQINTADLIGAMAYRDSRIAALTSRIELLEQENDSLRTLMRR